MSRLSRFEDYRFIGTRDTMRVFDCDNPEQFEELERRIEDEHLIDRKQIQSFAPDTIDEARNRGFKPVSSSSER
ncbi:MAG TPA: hypothetical protein VMM14_08295 [Acidimicrobiia bacterium]|nr:hypothetical protein [Acidimicrobiia bacterium]